MEKFNVGNGFTATCTHRRAAYGFYHFCTLYKDDKRIARAQALYMNRTWEAWNYQTVVKMAVKKCNHLSDTEKEALLEVLRIEPQHISII